MLALVVLVLCVQMYGRAYRDSGYDFTSYLLSAEALVHGQNPFETATSFTYSYPMFLAFVLIPLTAIPYWLANLLWFAMSLASLLAAILILVRPLTTRMNTLWGNHLYPIMALSLLLLIGVVQNNLLNGQVNALVLLLCALFLKYFQEQKPMRASLCLAAAGAIKLVPLILLVMVLVRRDIRTLFLSVILFVAFCLLPVILLGTEGFQIYQEYLQGFVVGKLTGMMAEDQIYFTLFGFITSVATAAKGWTALNVVCLGAVVVSVALIDLLAIRRNGRAAGWWSFHLYLLATLLIVPLSEKHHLIYMIPIVSILIIKTLYERIGQCRYTGATVVLSLACLYLGLVFRGPFYFLSLIALSAGAIRAAITTPESAAP